MIAMKQEMRRRTGRPRSFDRDAALDQAMRLFWRHGFEGVSFQQLTAALNVAAPSLYSAFGNKEALYREALNHYARVRGTNDLSIMDESRPLTEAVRALLQRTAEALVAPDGEMGCMLMIGMVTSHPDHVDLAREVADRRAAFGRLLHDKLQVWVKSDQADVLTRYLTAVIQGMTIQARDGSSLSELTGIFGSVLAGVDATSK
jgi:AcrR family transcriptional regulator